MRLSLYLTSKNTGAASQPGELRRASGPRPKPAADKVDRTTASMLVLAARTYRKEQSAGSRGCAWVRRV